MISVTDLKKKEPTWYDIIAAPSGKITSLEQYNYMITYNNYFNISFYWTDKDRHIPTFMECENKYLDMIDFFGGATFYFCVRNKGAEWSYGKYGKIKELS